jgi:sulfate transport system ATP-binding protein
LTPLGGLVRVELTLHDGTPLLVQLTRERSRELSLATDDAIFVAPKDMKVFHEPPQFVENYVI